MPEQCQVMMVTRRCPNPAVEGFDRCIVHLGSEGWEHWWGVAKFAGKIGGKAASLARGVNFAWEIISPFLKADQVGERATEYARIQRRLEEIAEAGKEDLPVGQATALEHELETLVIDAYNLVKSATATAEDNESVGAAE